MRAAETLHEGDRRRAPLRAMAWLLCAAVGPPLALRAWALALLATTPEAGDLRGALADLGAGALAAAALLGLGRMARVLVPLASALLAAVHVVNFEVVLALAAPVAAGDARMLLDPDFVRSALAGLSRPYGELSLALAAALLAWPGVRRPAARGAALRTAGASALLGATACAGAALWPEHADLALWRQTDVITHNAARLARRDGLPRSAQRIGADGLLALEPALAPPPDGEPIAPLGIVQNVLVVVVDSLSGAHLASLAADHGRPAPALLPRLDEYARRHLSFSTYFAHDRGSGQALYALLCGELPKLLGGRPKLAEYPGPALRRCLPERLRRQGFHTVHLQAAPLSLGSLDRFLRLAGVLELHGREDFTGAIRSTPWGVDDRTFYRRALEHVLRLEAKGDPWLLVLRSGGTHRPFVVPDDFESAAPSDLGRALGHLDGALTELLDELEARDLADDTLIVVTSGGSAGAVPPAAQRRTAELDQSWGALVVAAPQAEPRRISTPFAQSDLLLSVLDYLEAAPRERALIGRSVFRAAPPPRPIPFANRNLDRVGMLEAPAGPLVLCRAGVRACDAYAVGRGVFSGGLEPAAAPAAVLRLGALARAASLGVASLDPVLEIELAAPATLELPAPPRTVVLMEGQKVDLAPGQWLEVDLDLEVVPAPEDRPVEVRHSLRAERQRRHTSHFRMHSGERVRLVYTYAPERGEDGLEPRTIVRRISPAPVELRIHAAHLRLHREGTPPAPGLKRQRFERAFVS